MKRTAVDLAKSVYQIAENVRSGQVMQRKRLNREAFRRYIQGQAEPVEWVTEARGTVHYWGRVAQALGHQVRLLHPRYVRPYRRRDKTDHNGCDAMLEATHCTDIHPAPAESHDQQQLQQLHELREAWKKSRTQWVNLLRGLLYEAGIEASAPTAAFTHAVSERVDQPEPTPLSRPLYIVLAEVDLYKQCMVECEQQFKYWHVDDDIVYKLDEVNGIGLLTTSVLTAAVGRPGCFASGRQPSAWLGMTPYELSSGECHRLGHISRQGSVYVRILLIHGPRAASLVIQRRRARILEKLARL